MKRFLTVLVAFTLIITQFSFLEKNVGHGAEIVHAQDYDFVDSTSGFDADSIEWMDLSSAPTVDTLLDSSTKQERWLSIPDSRLVVNPYDYSGLIQNAANQYDTSNKPSMPLNIGYLDPELTKNSDKGIDGKGMNDSVVMFEKKFVGANEASSFSTSWQPHKLSFEASYSGGNTITGEDFFYDEKTIVRTVAVTGSKSMVIGGKLYGSARDAVINGNTITIPVDNSCYGTLVVAISIQGAGNIRLYSSEDNLKLGVQCAAITAKYWGATVTPSNGKAEIVISYAADKGNTDVVTEISKAPISRGDYADKLCARQAEWNNFLAMVPRTGDVSFSQIASEGVTSAEVKRMYYEAWCLIHASVLPQNPEMEFPYRQIATGKPSMWGHGDKKSLYSAQWDSLYGMQMYSYINPDIAWECFEGMMSLVNMSPENPKTYGMISGESLPNVTARTAWILYQNKPDKEKLEKVYDQLRQHQRWCMAHPNWIYEGNGSLDSTSKDSDYLAAIFVDIPYLIQIACELRKTDEVNSWNKEYVEYLNNYYEWDGGSNPNTLWETKALHIPELKKSFVDKLIQKLEDGLNDDINRIDHFDKEQPFCGFRNVKLDEIMYTIYGLMENGYKTEAHQLVESSVRDIVRAHFLSEVYAPNPKDHGGDNYGDGRLLASGVRPSVFGAVQLIDSVWILNGYRYDSGTPTMHTFFDGGYIENLRIDGRIFNAKVSGGNVTMAGTYCDENKEIYIGINQFCTEKSVGREATRYVDDTQETLEMWQDNTAQMDIVDDKGRVTVTNTGEIYGFISKAVQLNTVDFPILAVDIDSVQNAEWSFKCIVNDSGEDIPLITDNGNTGRTEINLLEKGIPRNRNISVTLKLYVIGKGEGKFVTINGFEASAQKLNIDFATVDGWIPSNNDLPITLTTEGGKGIFLLGQGTSGYGAISYYVNINTKDDRYLVFDMESADCNFDLQINDNDSKISCNKLVKKHYIDMQNPVFEQGYNANTKITLWLIGNPGDRVAIKRIYPVADRDIVDDFENDDWSKPEAGKGSVEISDNKMTVTKPAAYGYDVHAKKYFEIDTSGKHIVRFGISDFKAGWDDGFSIEILNENVAPWQTIKIFGTDLFKIAKPRENGGYDIYFDLSKLVEEKGLSLDNFVGENLILSIEIIVAWGNTDKSVTIDGITLLDQIPEK